MVVKLLMNGLGKVVGLVTLTVQKCVLPWLSPVAWEAGTVISTVVPATVLVRAGSVEIINVYSVAPLAGAQMIRKNRPSSVFAYFKTLRRFVNWMVEERVALDNPVINFPRPDGAINSSKLRLPRIFCFCSVTG